MCARLLARSLGVAFFEKLGLLAFLGGFWLCLFLKGGLPSAFVILSEAKYPQNQSVDFFAAATPCNPLGRYAQNDKTLPLRRHQKPMKPALQPSQSSALR